MVDSAESDSKPVYLVASIQNHACLTNISLTVPESKIMKPEHLIDDYALSRNIARFGLKVTTLNDIWAASGLVSAQGGPEFFYHQYLIDIDTKIEQVKETLEKWDL